MKNVVFMFVTPALSGDEKKYNMQKLMDLGYQITIADITPALMPKTEAAVSQDRINLKGIDCHRFKTKREIEAFVKKHCRDSFFFPMFAYYYQVSFIYRLFTKYNIKYGYVGLTTDFDEVMRSHKKLKRKLLLKLKPSYIMGVFYIRFVRKIIKYKAAEFSAFGTKSGERTFGERYMQDAHTKKLYTHTHDYERFMSISPYDNGGRKYCVFIDTYLPFHPDSIVDEGIFIDPKIYFSELREIFKQVQDKTGFEIIIAAHPRANYRDKPQCYGNYKIEYAKTAELIKSADLVLGQFSTSIGMVAIAKKPLGILLLPSCDSVYGWVNACKSYVKMFECAMIRTPKDVEKLSLDFNSSAYDRFAKRFMTTGKNNDRSLWDVITENIH